MQSSFEAERDPQPEGKRRLRRTGRACLAFAILVVLAVALLFGLFYLVAVAIAIGLTELLRPP
jgi:hypothetical protein